MLLVVVVSPVYVHAPSLEEASHLLEAAGATCPLRHDKPMEHLEAAPVAPSPSPIRLFDETDGEAAFPIHEADHPVSTDWPFLLVFRTGRIVTAHDGSLG